MVSKANARKLDPTKMKRYSIKEKLRHPPTYSTAPLKKYSSIFHSLLLGKS